jgi:transcriptional regulator with XRE-family HTH domain
MADESATALAGLLRQLRKQAGLTQEELAERAGLATRSVSDMERGITLGQAEVLNNMGEALLAGGAAGDAEARHREALDIAVGIAAPAEEARAREGIGRRQLLAGHAAEGGQELRRALAIYQRINSTNTERVAALLREQQP